MKSEILFLTPHFTHNIWGGTRLITEFRYQIEGTDIGECWGIAAHDHGESVVREGKYQGKTLSKLWKEVPELFGNVDKDRFPLLVKIIDAREDLSIQVHPDDSYAMAMEDGSLGKTECWYILDCKKGSKLVIGHNASTREELEEMIIQGRWEELIREIPVKKGDFIQIDPGTVHAIKGGILLLETQQNSDITYRVYDYGRLSDGVPRELHIEKSIDVITVPAAKPEDSVIDASEVPVNQWCALIANNYYRVWKLDLNGSLEFKQEFPFFLMTVVEGAGTINGRELHKGDHLILPSGFGKVKLEGSLQVIASTIHDEA